MTYPDWTDAEPWHLVDGAGNEIEVGDRVIVNKRMATIVRVTDWDLGAKVGQLVAPRVVVTFPDTGGAWMNVHGMIDLDVSQISYGELEKVDG